MLLLTFSFALAATVLRQPGADAGDFLLVAALFWVMAGLANQIGDLFAVLRATPGLDRALRFGLWFEIACRFALAAFLPGYYCVGKSITGPFYVWLDEKPFTSALWLAVLVPTLLMILDNNPRLVRTKLAALPRSRFQHLIEMAGWVCGVVLAVIFLLGQSAIPFLVTIAVNGIGNAWSARFTLSPPGERLSRQLALLEWSALGSTCAIVAILRARAVARHGASGGRAWWRILTLVASLVVVVGMAAWITGYGAQYALPMFMLEDQPRPLSVWPPAIAILALVATGGTIRFLRPVRCELTARSPVVNWHPRRQNYYHEQRWLVALVAIAAATKLSLLLYRAMVERGLPPAPAMSLLVPLLGTNINLLPDWLISAIDVTWGGLQIAVEEVADLHRLLWLALALGAAQAAWARRVPAEKASEPRTILPLPAARFAVVWCTLLVTLAAGAVSLAWLSLSVWFLLPLLGSG